MLRELLWCSRMLLVATGAPKINKFQAIGVFAYKKSKSSDVQILRARPFSGSFVESGDYPSAFFPQSYGPRRITV